ncbi:MAG: PD-(D/E)XK nuclease family protein [Acidimicrobiaceae bacterium]|nr:PD-(D/E)XK nuclease family protein [Acidimicrobiaceae bacterium]
MSLQVPSSLTPSKVSSFKECAYAFRLAVIEHVPQPVNSHTLKGTLAHRCLDRLYFDNPPENRTLDVARDIFNDVWLEAQNSGELDYLEECEKGCIDLNELAKDTTFLIEQDFIAENPQSVTALGTEIQLEARVGDMTLRGIIDRLDLNPDGTITVTDYKTGRIPGVMQEHDRLSGVYFYALLCEQVLHVVPDTVQLVYLRDATRIIAKPSKQSMTALLNRAGAIWKAVRNACEREDFRPKPSKLCGFCNFKLLCPTQHTD